MIFEVRKVVKKRKEINEISDKSLNFVHTQDNC